MPAEGILSEQESLEDSKGSKSPWYVDEFTKVLIATTVAGGTAALLIPILLWLIWNMSPDNVGQLRFHILCITGGFIAVLAIFQIYWKNQLTSLKIREYIRKNRQDAIANEQTRLDNVRAERRSRFSKAIEKLAHDKATIRMGGAYTLLRLADEWLLDDSFNDNERKLEGQIIVDNLCAYIRSLFPLAEKKILLENNDLTELEIKKYEGNFVSDKAELRGEQDLRKTILEQICFRLGFNETDGIDGEKTPSDGLWSDFYYDFSDAVFFYPFSLGNSAINGNVYFKNSIFKDSANFSNIIFTGCAFFNNATFQHFTDFSNTKFNDATIFNKANFFEFADFENAIFLSSPDFSSSTFAGMANFENSTFYKSAHFSEATFKDLTNFGNSSIRAFADFSSSSFTKIVSFSSTRFLDAADFNSTIFSGPARFRNSTFTGSTNFIGAILEESIDFSESIFAHEAPLFAAESTLPARFSYEVEPENYIFTVSSQSPHKIKTEEFSPLGDKIFNLPEGCLLFTPNPKAYMKIEDN